MAASRTSPLAQVASVLVPGALRHAFGSWLRLGALLTLFATLAAGCSGAAPSTTKPATPSEEAATPATLGTLAAGEPASPLPVEADDGVWGRGEAPVTLVAFLDFECGFCARGFATLQHLQEEYGPERLRIVIKHLPLEFHPDALPAAVAAQAVRDAAGNEAFFKYAALLFTNQRSLDPTSLAEFAENVGLDRGIYNEAVSDERTFRAVVHDVELAQRLGITGTPAFYVNGRLIQGAQPIDSFREFIDAEVRVMAELLEKGTPWATAYANRVKRNVHDSISEQLLAKDPAIYRAIVDGSPTLGSSDALVTLVEFSDFECPFCKRARPTIAQLKKKYGAKLRVVFKHLPLDFHRQAKPAARLADAVHRKGGDAAFWRAVDLLFAAESLSEDHLVALGQELGLTEQEARDAVRSDAPNARLDKDAALAADLEANGTPHFFVNGRRITGAQPLAHFEVFIDAALAEAERMVAEGTEPSRVYDRLMEKAETPGIPQKVSAETLAALDAAKRPSRGPSAAPVTLHVFSDFECPYCRSSELTLGELERRYEGRLRIVWHHLPLPFHQQARPAAHAAEEAFLQAGNAAFWKMHAALFDLEGERPALSRAELEEHAKKVGLDLARFQKALDTRAHEEAISDDEELAASLGIRGTPTFVVGGYLVQGAQPLRVFERVIERALAEAK